MSRPLALSLLLLSLAGGCGATPDAGDDATTLPDGNTACGPVSCGAGQYCFDPAAGLCENGCTSDQNCLSDEDCVITDTFFNEGECQPRGGEAKGTDDDPLTACQEACDHFQTCGLPPAQTAACRDDCAALSDNERDVVANCDALSCGDTLDCLGLQCFSDDDCGQGKGCLDFVCV